ncbi:MAG: alpha/beta hydrolase family protein [Candidatus Polarisedimenticolia bacterium]
MSYRLAAGLVAVAVMAGAAVFHPSRPLYMRHRSLDVVAPDGVILSATLSLPRWRSAPLTGMVMVHGSGPLTREHLMGDVRRLVWEGFAVLAYDKRGVGESGGEYPRSRSVGAEATLRILAADAAAALSRLREEPEIDPAQAGFFGASQASWIIPLATESLDRAPRFQVILSGAAVSTGVEQFYSDLTGDGHRPPQITDREEIERLVSAFDGEPGYDPWPVLMAMRVPTLWILGDRDQSVPVFATVKVLKALPPDAAACHTVIRFPDADHALRDVTTGKPSPVWSAVLSWMEAPDEGVECPAN